ncbi:hypothetical protein GCM10022234_00370 [Aeromicrobium panaciterrae]|uniref:hypothetical protein n=1 Tax=Aeromicrobium panaciterrae TaxID=363861 RepID=UPI0031E2C223
MSAYTVAATWKGEQVHLSEERFGAHTLSTLNWSPVPLSREDAERIRARADRDETLRDVRMYAL